MTRPGRLALRVVFALLLLSLPAMIVVRERVGEAYPGLYQPAFDTSHMRGDTFRRNEVEVVVRDAAGVDYTVGVDRLVDAPAVDRTTVDGMMRSLLRDRTAVRSPAVSVPLRDRLVDLGLTSPVRMTVTWYATTRDPHHPEDVVRGRRVTRYSVRLDG